MRPQTRPARRQLVRDLVLVALAIASVVIGIVQFSAEPVPTMTPLDWADLAIVAAFWVDFALESRRVGLRRYVRTHWWELPSLVPAVPALVALFPAVAFVRALRLLRLVRVVSVLLRLRPMGSMVVSVARRARVDVILGIGATITLLGSLAAWLLESRANPDMATFGQALWFALNMFTNVAYLDFQPATLGGRILAGMLQIAGIAFIGVFTASIAGAIVQTSREE